MFEIDDRLYDILKWIITIVLPAVETLWLGLGKVWGFPLVTEVGTTIALITAFLGTIFMISSVSYNKPIPMDVEGLKYLEDDEVEADEQD